MFKWLGRKVEIAGIKGATDDLERFIQALRGASDQEVGFIVAMATLQRLNLEEAGEMPRYVLDLSLPCDQKIADLMQWKLNRIITDFQKSGNPAFATGMMVWLHSVRALNMPEIRLLGRTMWGELRRGFETAVESAEDLRDTVLFPLPAGIEDEVKFIPVGLEPR